MCRITTRLVLILSIFALSLAACNGTEPTATSTNVPPTVTSQEDGESPASDCDDAGLDESGNEETGCESPVYSFVDAPVEIIRWDATGEFTLPTGDTHTYEVVYLPEGGINWPQARALAKEAGGYLVSVTSEEEGDFVLSLVEDEKYWFQWGETHNYVMNGPFLGGYQPAGSDEPDGNWQWVSGEPFEYTNWAYDGMAGDEDPRPNDQPNDATGNQNVIALGEVNIPVSTWGDFPHRLSSYNDPNEGGVYGFVIEYDQEPQGEGAVAPTAPATTAETYSGDLIYPIVDTGQTVCYDDSGVITCPSEGQSFYGQDAQHSGNALSYTDNGDGTVTDNVTGLIWQQSADTDTDGDIDAADKMTYEAAGTYCETLSLAGYDDWQLPDIKQLYSLIDFGGLDPSGYNGTDTSGLVPFIDTDYFDFAYGDTAANERIIDAQYASSSHYVGTAGERLLFGVNFADGRIKGYGLSMRGRDKTFAVLCTRDNSSYGVNDFVDNGDGTITDNATGLMWAQDDSGTGLIWEEALAWVETQNDANYLGYSDWRLPNVKELQSIVDYSRSPDTTDSAAIDPLFNATSITNELGQTDYPFYWSSTTHASAAAQPGTAGAYVAFGRALGYMNDAWVDVHGAGAQRSDPKEGDPADYATGRGPQGDAIRIYNYVRLVRGGDVTAAVADGVSDTTGTAVTEDIIGTEQQPAEAAFTLTSPDVVDGRRLPVEYTCDGDGATLPLVWSGAPAGTVEYAVIMHHVAAPDDIHWYWVLYDLPADVTGLPKDASGIGTLGNNVNTGLAEYSPPCSKGPGDKEYIYTVYALSAQPQISFPASEVSRAVMLDAIDDVTLASAELHTVYARHGMDDPQGQSARPSDLATPQQHEGRTPPAEAYAACNDKTENASCEFTDQNGSHTGVCKTEQDTLVCAPSRVGQNGQPGGGPPQGGDPPGGHPPDAHGNSYNIDQAISDKAQGMTIAFDALAFLTGDLAANSFFPPGKVADFWGFQYLRDNDTSQMGHAGDFLTGAAMNVLNVLTADQRAQLVALAESQVDDINQYAYNRLVLIDAFQRLLDGDLPAGTTGLDEDAIKAYSVELYLLDGEISYARAEVIGSLLNALSDDQRAYLDKMAAQGMLEWPNVEEPEDIRGLDRDAKVAVMTYAADMFSWYAGSVEADVYFCPERHGTYFGSFYLKDIKAMSDSSYAIPTDLTGNLGNEMLSVLNADQAKLIAGLVDIQKPSLLGIVETREQISIELRRFLEGGAADRATVLALMQHYGELDGEIIYHLATNFTAVDQSLTSEQEVQLEMMRTELLGELSHPSSAYLYSQAIPMPEIPDTDFLFGR